MSPFKELGYETPIRYKGLTAQVDSLFACDIVSDQEKLVVFWGFGNGGFYMNKGNLLKRENKEEMTEISSWVYDNLDTPIVDDLGSVTSIRGVVDSLAGCVNEVKAHILHGLPMAIYELFRLSMFTVSEEEVGKKKKMALEILRMAITDNQRYQVRPDMHIQVLLKV